MSVLRPVTDGLVVVRPPEPGDSEMLVARRDDVFHRWLGPGDTDPQPVGCIVVAGEIVGWVDYDVDREWLQRGEVNIGYNVFAPHRGMGYASRSVQLLMHHLAVRSEHHTATLLIHPHNERSLALAGRTRFLLRGDIDGNSYFTRLVPSLTYSAGGVTIRRQRVGDIGADLEAKDGEQIDWLWLPGQRESWEAMTPDEQRAHALRGLQANYDAFGMGPKWTFAVDAPGRDSVAYVDCDLANEHVPPGEANISYASHPAHRGLGYASRAVRLIIQFLGDHTGTRKAHLIVDAENLPSLRVAASVGAAAEECWMNDRGRTMIRHVLRI